jgi:uncharacterized membrane protein YeaQ/YmgE (transglycosylase-associated protein family)
MGQRDVLKTPVQPILPKDAQMGIISWIVLGLIAGLLAKLIMPGQDLGGIIVTIGIGIVGAVIGGFLATSFGLGAVSDLNVGSIVIAIVG